MDDLISRQAARDVVYKAFADMHTSSRDRLAEIDYGLLDLQSAQAEPKTNESGFVPFEDGETSHDRTTDDLISRQAAIDAFLTLGFVWDDSLSDVEKEELDYAIHGIIMAYKERIEQLPSAQPEITPDGTLKVTVDADIVSIGRILLSQAGTQRGGLYYKDEQPEIIRCKDCKWKQGAECVRFAEIRVFPNDFCSRSERRTDGTEQP